MTTSTAPRIRRTAQNIQFTYNLSRRVNDVQTYPIQSPQGATILIYGHENGVTLVWRGGKRFKPARKAPTKDTSNGSADPDSVMIIDSDDDEPAPKFEDKPEFENEIDDVPYPETIQTLDLTLGTAVLNVAVMPLAPRPAKDAAGGRASLLSQNMVFAVSCVTNDVYLITLPLTPPSPESKARPELRKDLLAGKAGSGAWGESLVLLGGQSKLSEGIAMGLILPDAAECSGKPARAVVASHSREASGVLRLWEVSLDPKAKLESRVEPFQTEYLLSPLRNIAFNPTHTTQLLAVSSPHGVRVYDFALPSLPPDAEATGPFPAQGSWLLTLYQPFAKPSSSRKPIVDAAWIAHGRAVFALLADGMWGVWDIDGVSHTPTAEISTKLKPGVRGAALTTFSVSGYVEGTSSLRSVASQPNETQYGEFAPMTPHTRRQATASLSSAATLDRLATIHGGVKVTALPAGGKAALSDESLALWVGGLEHVCLIPAVSRFWESQLRKNGGDGGVFYSASQPTKMIKLQDLSTGLLGERCCGLTLIARGTGEIPVDVLIRGETRLVVVREGEPGPGKQLGLVTRKRLFSKDANSNAIIVHGKTKPATVSFNLSTAKHGSLRSRVTFNEANEEPVSSRSAGFSFGSTLEDAADTTADGNRDVEVEMLDIMEIDKALDGLGGRKRVLFEEN